eukprot:COSAG01_NODE_23955_length_795_cov_2.433908_1_plen_20_part_10
MLPLNSTTHTVELEHTFVLR